MDAICWWNLRKLKLAALFMFFALMVDVESRPYFRSHFYMDQNHVRGMSNAHYGAQAESNDHQGAPEAELRFVSFDRERKTLVEKKIDLSNMNQDPAFDNFHLIQFLNGYRSDMRRQFAILRHQSRANYRRKAPHGITGLWG